MVEGPDPEDPSKALESEVAESTPTVLKGLVEEQFRTVAIAAGNNVSVALSSEGKLKAWGSFRVCSFRPHGAQISHQLRTVQRRCIRV
jgi:alpha-tubulin suppressor-like RCC1 family protein